MSEKSFSEQIARSVVKNPLLSSAVTGLSLEDLTHNAVLLPVKNQELGAGQDSIKDGSQTISSRNTSNLNVDNQNSQTYDTASNIANPQIINANIITQTTSNYGQNFEQISSETHSKASVKSDDDFDVNEYFARLQGTRYVSAPLNSFRKEDENANLGSTEENLEEINLNDSRSSEDTQQSITADIAQNFSQLPQVLPHVASAVFSSFSSILSLKSREQTPDNNSKLQDFSGYQEDARKSESSGYQEVSFQKPENERLLEKPPLSPGEPVDAKPIGVPPCHALPPGSTSNTFRITTKRKAYAPIPGLTTEHKIGDTSQYPMQAPSQSYTPTYFKPYDTVHPPMNSSDFRKNDLSSDTPKLGIIENQTAKTISNVDESTKQANVSKEDNTNAVSFVTMESTKDDAPFQYCPMFESKTSVPERQVFQPSTGILNQSNIPLYDNNSQSSEISLPYPTYSVEKQNVPPPPTFTAPPSRRNDQSSGVKKSILPPSVARRIGLTQPVLKSTNVAPVIDANIFVPKSLPESDVDQTISGKEFFDLPGKDNLILFDQTNQRKFIVEPPKFFDSTTSSSTENTLSQEKVPIVSQHQTVFKDQNVSLEPPKFFNPAMLSTEENSIRNLNVLETQTQENQNLDAIPPNPIKSAIFSPLGNAVLQGNVNTTQFSSFSQIQEEKPPKLPEPPKIPAGNQNYRMTKKRPQYYSGIIDGVSLIGNQMPPTSLTAQTIHKGNVFTPEVETPPQEIQSSVQSEKYNLPNLPPSMLPSDNLTVTSAFQDYQASPFDITKPLMQDYSSDISQGQAFNTSFDLSRSTIENTDSPKEEPRSFGIIGSLKSKFNAIDINKIQNSVTTFFDPGYNDVKKDTTSTFQIPGARTVHSSMDDQNIDIFIPHIDPKLHQGVQMRYQTYDDLEQLKKQGYYGSYNNPNHSLVDSSEYSQLSYYNQDYSSPQYSQQSYGQISNENNIGTSVDCHEEFKGNPLSVNLQSENSVTDSASKEVFTRVDPIEIGSEAVEIADTSQTIHSSCSLAETEPSFFLRNDQIAQSWANPMYPMNMENTMSSQPRQNAFGTIKNIKSTAFDEKWNTDNFILHCDSASSNTQRKNSTAETKQIDLSLTSDSNFMPVPDNLIKQHDIKNDPPSTAHGNIFFSKEIPQQVSSFFDIGIDTVTPMGTNKAQPFNPFASNTLSLNPTHAPVLDNENVSEIQCSACTADITAKSHTRPDAVHSAISTPNNEKNLSRKASVSDLNICETCREVNTLQEEKEREDLTTQLIENITAPIQLLNPVEVPLTENLPPTERTFFDNDQCDEITLITEETMETLQGQSANDFFDKKDIDEVERISNVSHEATEGSVNNYGWRSETEGETDDPITSLIDHNYSFPSNPNAVGFYSGNSLYFDEVHTFTNASDEIKAVFINAHEENGSAILSRQMSIPTAPPAEDFDEDNKSDVTGGIDVCLIEQDANKDFPVFEEYIIEPSGTDDDKIEIREREKSCDAMTHIDSFTDRVERYKQTEEHPAFSQNIAENVQIFENIATVASPVKTLASYFDTGNYAAETHYRNSLIVSPDSLAVSVINNPMSSSMASSTQAVQSIDTEASKTLKNCIFNVQSADGMTESVLINKTSESDSMDEQMLGISAELREITKFSQSEIYTTTENYETSIDTGHSEISTIDDSITLNKELPRKGSLNTNESNEQIEEVPHSASRIDNSETVLPKTVEVFRTTADDFLTPCVTSFAKLETSRTGKADPLESDPKINREEENFSSELSARPTLLSSNNFFQTLSMESTSNPLLTFEKPSERTDNTLEKNMPISSKKTNLPEEFCPSSELNISGSPISFVTNPETLYFENVPHIKSNILEKESQPKNRKLSFVTENMLQSVTSGSYFIPFASSTIEQSLSKSHNPESKVHNTYDKNFSIGVTSPSNPSNQACNILPDPVSFFDTNPCESEEKSDNQDEGFNRLASYFSSPPKTDHSKSFFGLSQSQNHFMQPSKNGATSNIERNKTEYNNTKPFFELSQGQNQNVESKLTNEQYIANLELMKNLTSIDNLDRKFNNDNVVTTVSYCAVHYDNVILNKVNTNDKNKNSTSNTENIKIVDDKKTIPGNVTDSNRNNNLKTVFNINNKQIQSIEGSITDDILSTDRNINFNIGNLKNSLNESEFVDGKETNVINIILKCKHCYNSTGVIKNISFDDYRLIGDCKYSVREKMNSESDAKKSNMKDVENQLGSRETKKNTNVIFGGSYTDEDDTTLLSHDNRSSTEFSPLIHHWYYRIDTDGKSLWKSFSETDSRALEDAYSSPDLNENTWVATDGGRFDVNIKSRTRKPVYWDEKPNNVRRCSWFYKGSTDAKYVPYTEPISEKLEMEYRHGVSTGEWHRRTSLPNNEAVVMHGPAVIVHFVQPAPGDAWGATAQSTVRPRVVRRGHITAEMEPGEPAQIDHLILMVHGVGSACDIRFRPIVEVVDDFRTTSLQLLQSHYRNSCESRVVGRVEVLPISWHGTLHSGEAGVDRRLAEITLDSIPRLRSFTNDTVLDVLFYTSPVYSQIIVDTVCSEMNRIYNLFKQRNPTFNGTVSLGGHSLGSVILYDLLCHQYQKDFKDSDRESNPPPAVTLKRYLDSPAAGHSTMKYPTLDFEPDALYALGSPIAMFECIRGVEFLGEDFHLPTCRKFFNIFHPYDPIAYRIEPLINRNYKSVPPYLIPHHKGRKRMHLELKETMARVGADLRQKFMDSIRTTFTQLWKPQPPEQEIRKVVDEVMEKEDLTTVQDQTAVNMDAASPSERVGKLNGGRRVDRVLQEAPLEMINEYIFAMGSHVGYWESEDTMLLILREVYDDLGVCPDGRIPPPNLTVEREKQVSTDEQSAHTTVDGGPSTSAGLS